MREMMRRFYHAWIRTPTSGSAFTLRFRRTTFMRVVFVSFSPTPKETRSEWLVDEECLRA